MSVLSGKHVLVVGDETTQVKNIANSLSQEGASITSKACHETTAELLTQKKIDIVILNHLHDNRHCKKLLAQIQNRRDTKLLPVFVLVTRARQDIEHALTMGAADYFTADETAKSLMNKIRIVMGDSVNAADNNIIDIGQSHVNTNLSGIRVFVVEDDPLLANLLSISFDRASFPYHINTTGKDIATELDKFKADVVVLDLMLPGISGFEILTNLRNNQKYQEIPIFIFSNRDAAEDKQKAIELGATGFYVKAMTDLSELMKAIEDEVQSHSSK